MDFTPTDDRTKWPTEAVEVAESCGLPDGSWFFGVVPWPLKHAYTDEITLPRQPRGERTFRWVPCRPVVGLRPEQRMFLYAQRWPERENVIAAGRTDRRDILVPFIDPMEKTA